MRILCFLFVLWGAFLAPSVLYAQVEDSTAVEGDTTMAGQILNDIRESKLSQRILKSITRKRRSDPVAAVRSEAAFLPYEGRVIRNIILRHIDFQKTVYDTTKNIRNTITKVGNKLHSTTKDWVIRDNLFIREDSPLNPYKLADNERHLRDLDFLLDAKFYIIPLNHSPDSVDIVVLTRDVFSLGGTINLDVQDPVQRGREVALCHHDGSIATGKSTVLDMMAGLNIPTISSDAIVHRLYAGPASQAIEHAFPGVIDKGVVDRAKLSAALLAHPDAIELPLRQIEESLSEGTRFDPVAAGPLRAQLPSFRQMAALTRIHGLVWSFAPRRHAQPVAEEGFTTPNPPQTST